MGWQEPFKPAKYRMINTFFYKTPDVKEKLFFFHGPGYKVRSLNYTLFLEVLQK